MVIEIGRHRWVAPCTHACTNGRMHTRRDLDPDKQYHAMPHKARRIRCTVGGTAKGTGHVAQVTQLTAHSTELTVKGTHSLRTQWANVVGRRNTNDMGRVGAPSQSPRFRGCTNPKCGDLMASWGNECHESTESPSKPLFCHRPLAKGLQTNPCTIALRIGLVVIPSTPAPQISRFFGALMCCDQAITTIDNLHQVPPHLPRFGGAILSGVFHNQLCAAPTLITQ